MDFMKLTAEEKKTRISSLLFSNEFCVTIYKTECDTNIYGWQYVVLAAEDNPDAIKEMMTKK